MLRSISTRFLLLAPEGDGGASGMGGEGGQGNSGTPGDGGSGGTGTPGTGGQAATGDLGPEWAKGWEGVEADLLGDPSLKAIQTPAALLKSYVHAQRMQGRDKVILPNDKSTKEERDQFYQKLGVPLEEQKYLESVKFDKDKNFLGEEVGKEYVKLAHSLRVLPDQAQKLYEFANTQTQAQATRAAEKAASEAQTQLDALQAKLGPDAYSVKLTKATNFVKENAPPAFLELLGKSGLGKNAVVVEALMQMADKFTKEDNLPGGTNMSAQTIDELQGEINTMMGDMKGPYHNTNHPDHQRQVDHMLNLQTKLDNARKRS